MEYYDEDDEEQYPYDGVSYTAGDAVSDSKKKVISLGISAYSGGNDTPVDANADRLDKMAKAKAYREMLERDKSALVHESRKPIVRNSIGNGNGQTTLLIGNDANKQDLFDQKRAFQLNYKAQLEADIRAKKMHQEMPKVHVLRKMNPKDLDNDTPPPRVRHVAPTNNEPATFQIGGSGDDRLLRSKIAAREIAERNKADILAKISSIPVHDLYNQMQPLKRTSTREAEFAKLDTTTGFFIGQDESVSRDKKKDSQRQYYAMLENDTGGSNKPAKNYGSLAPDSDAWGSDSKNAFVVGGKSYDQPKFQTVGNFDDKASKQAAYREMLQDQMQQKYVMSKNAAAKEAAFDSRAPLPYMRY